MDSKDFKEEIWLILENDYAFYKATQRGDKDSMYVIYQSKSREIISREMKRLREISKEACRETLLDFLERKDEE